MQLSQALLHHLRFKLLLLLPFATAGLLPSAAPPPRTANVNPVDPFDRAPTCTYTCQYVASGPVLWQLTLVLFLELIQVYMFLKLIHGSSTFISYVYLEKNTSVKTLDALPLNQCHCHVLESQLLVPEATIPYTELCCKQPSLQLTVHSR